MGKILITTSSFNCEAPEIKALESAGYEIVLNPHKRRLTEDEVVELLGDESIIGMIAGVEPLTKKVLENAKGLRIVSRCGTGLDSVDLDAAKALGIKVFNTPDAPTKAVAELAVGLMLDALRGISLQDRSIRVEGWERPMGGLLGARTVGLIGYGRIARKVAHYVRAFGATVVAFDPHVKDSGDETAMVDFDTLLGSADIVSLHVPFTDENRNMIGKEALERMKDSAILINTARGGLVDETALAAALEKGVIGCAALDVFEVEPYKGPLAKVEKAILTAHVGSYAKEARMAQESEAAANLLAGLNNEEVEDRAYG